jgi:hypothetical protein
MSVHFANYYFSCKYRVQALKINLITLKKA